MSGDRDAGVGEPRSWDALVAAHPLPRVEARALLEHASGRPREWLVAHGDEAADTGSAARYEALARRRADGEPLAYLVGHREFFGRRFDVTPDVLIPRPETELLVQWALAHAPTGARVVDLGTGSGAIAVTLACERPDLAVTATDRSPGALAVAARNASSLGATQVRLRSGDWWSAVEADERFALIVANPPYVAAGDAHLDEGDLRFEPAVALTDGADGLDALRRIVAGAPDHLDAGGWLAMEHGWDQGAAVRALLAAAGFTEVRTITDEEGRDRIGVGRMPGVPRPRPLRGEADGA